MAVSFEQARDFVYSNGVIWERALFGYLFQGMPLERVHQCLLCYKNKDGGWGHALEHDIRTPESHPLALEFLLTVLRITHIPIGNLLDGTAGWVEANQNPDGSLRNPSSVLDYPHAPWWNEGGQSMPDSITGNLSHFGSSSPTLNESTRRWVTQNLTLDKIAANEWLFMAYHPYHYFFGVNDFPDLETYQQATIQNIIDCAKRAPENQLSGLFSFAPSPDSPVAKRLPSDLTERCLDSIQSSQREDGGWGDEHGLPQWQPWVTICNLLVLRNYGRIRL